MNQKIYIISALFACLMLPAQNYTWQWGQYGGGSEGSFGSGFSYTNDESIRDIEVDSDNNYYYLATINPGSPTLNGAPVPNYDKQDLFLFSTDCQGNVRWTRTIGGWNRNEFAWNIELDNAGGIYILGNFSNFTGVQSPNIPPIHFSDTVVLPNLVVPNSDTTTPDPGLKTAYLLKYKTSNGTLEWHKELQGDVTWPLRNADSAIFTMDSSKNIHAILGFKAGSHLNGTITVPASFTDSYQYYLVKFAYDNGNMTPELNPLLLPVTGSITQGLGEGKVNLVFDEGLDRYYLAGKRMESGTFLYSDFSYSGVPFTEDGYLLAFQGKNSPQPGTELWRKEFTMSNNPANMPDDNSVFDIVKDPNTSDIYITGYYYIYNQNGSTVFNNNVSFGNYTFPYIFNGYNPYVMKLNATGQVQWATIPTAISTNSIEGYRFMKSRIVINNNEIALVKGSRGDTWGSFPMVRPANDGADPLLVRLHRDTGAVLGAYDILSGYGTMDELTAVAVDQDGNYVVGGFKHSSLFLDPNDGVPDLHGNTLSGKSQFFFAKLATSSSCTQMNTAETPLKQTDVVFYPNPVNDVLHIKTKEKLTSYEVITADGRLMKQGTFTGNFTIDMSG
ncbi:MAG: T9SS type A sorting domain-containing protein, partial [Chryseobacterium sp.]|nr:T9SS type A sorting domain-containing protein [Chryseobacterium sp.]